MPYIATRRTNNIFARKISRYLAYRKAKRLFGEINRKLSSFEFMLSKSR